MGRIAVVGAGAAGIGAARRLAELGVEHVVVEASHRIGGRAHSEWAAPGIPFDLGCHWLHSASLNPLVAVADRLGFRYRNAPRRLRTWLGGRWASPEEEAAREAFAEAAFAAVDAAAAGPNDASVADVTNRDDPWTPVFDHTIALWCAADPDRVSVHDLAAYDDTGEDWPVVDGYGRLIAALGAGVPVTLNAAVTEIDRSGPRLRLSTAKGTVEAERAIVTVSTGVLGGGDIRFSPPLPETVEAAIAGLPLGNQNRVCLVLDGNPLGADHADAVILVEDGAEPVQLMLRPYGYDCVVVTVGGRFADWLERAGLTAMTGYAEDALAKLFGERVRARIVRRIASAWRGDGWSRGAYSSALPGAAGMRVRLAEPVDERLFFAGEASHGRFYATAHGAYLAGIDAAERAARSLGR